MNEFLTDLRIYNYNSNVQRAEFRGGVCRVSASFGSEKSLLALEGKKTCIIIYYVQVFMVLLRLAHAEQLGDINLTPGPCSLIPAVALSVRVPAPSIAPGSWFPAQSTWPPYIASTISKGRRGSMPSANSRANIPSPSTL